jgi:hypothetical protein
MCVVSIHIAAEGPQARFEFRDVALQMAEPARVRVTRKRSTLSPPATRWELDTRGTPLPCSLLADHLPALQLVGNADVDVSGKCRSHSDARRLARGTGWPLSICRPRSIGQRALRSSANRVAEVLLRRARFQHGKLTLTPQGIFRAKAGLSAGRCWLKPIRRSGVVADSRVRALAADMLWRYRALKIRLRDQSRGPADHRAL